MSKGGRLKDFHLVNGIDAPRDPQVAGAVGKRRAVVGWLPDANGNRGERRAAARQEAREAKRAR